MHQHRQRVFTQPGPMPVSNGRVLPGTDIMGGKNTSSSFSPEATGAAVMRIQDAHEAVDYWEKRPAS